jgi:hypothetical protein
MLPMSLPNLSFSSNPVATSGSDAKVNNLAGGMFNRSGPSFSTVLVLGLIFIVVAFILKK